MAYQQYPTTGSQNLPQRLAPPPSVRNAVKLMYAGAVLSVLELIVGLTTLGSLKSAIRQADPKYTASQVNSAEAFGVAIIILIGLLGAGLWVWMARANEAGRNWARIVASVLFGIYTLELVSALTRANSSIGLALDFVVWLVGLGAIVFLWRRDSSEFFAASR